MQSLPPNFGIAHSESLNHGGPDRLPFSSFLQKKEKSTFSPPTFAKVRFSSINFKTGQTTSLSFSNRAFYLPGAVLKAGCYSKRWYATVNGGFATVSVFCLFFFLFILSESLKNHSKSQKNYKIKNSILLHYT
jgi:hypothetical protein